MSGSEIIKREYTYTTSERMIVTFTVPDLSDGDDLEVYINGLKAIPTIDYNVTENVVTLTKELEAGQTVNFTVRSIPSIPMSTVLVDKIKTRLGVTGSYHDALILAYADDVKAFMHSAGVSIELLDDDRSVGAISRGVADLWNMGSGNGAFSQVFYQRVSQLVLLKDGIEEGVITDMSAISDSEIDECVECLHD